jgi:hypothetical protein
MSSDTIVIKLGAISKGERITTLVIAACGSSGTIVVRDDAKIYATLPKNSGGQAQLVGPATGVYEGAPNLRVELNATHPSYTIKLKPLVNHQTISDGTGGIKGGAYTIAVEDWTDDDYNDYVISVVSTKKAN